MDARLFTVVCVAFVYCYRKPYREPHSPPLPSMQDPTKDGEERIKADFAALNESLLEAFRKLEEA